MSQSEDMTAIHEYMKRTAPVTPEATSLRSSWLSWFPTLGWWDLNQSEKVRDEASTRRNKFNLANAVTSTQKAQVVQVITKGMDSNQMQGKPRKATLPTGEVGTQIKMPSALTGTHPTIKQGSKGPAVMEWQRIINVKVDGNFGPGTKTATINYQKSKGLTADGVVGPSTWTMALGKTPIEATSAPAASPGLLASIFGPKPSAQTASQPTVKAQMPWPNPASTAKPSGKSSATPPAPVGTASGNTGAVAAVKEKAAVMQAGMMGGFEKLPLWTKVAGGAALLAAMFFGRNAKMVHYGAKASRRFRRA